jgi:hypothetical protein
LARATPPQAQTQPTEAEGQAVSKPKPDPKLPYPIPPDHKGGTKTTKHEDIHSTQ